MYSTAVIDNEDTHSNLFGGHCFTGGDTNKFCPWSLKIEKIFQETHQYLIYIGSELWI